MSLSVALDAEIVHGFTEAVLKPSFDNPQPTPDFHKELWELCCLDEPFVGAAAPRGHAKSTAVTHSFTLALVAFRIRRFGLIISDTELQASLFLADIKNEIKENTYLHDMFGISPILIKDTETDMIGQFTDGTQFRIMAKGSGQKVRGTKWRNKRPDFVICDDLENEEIVFNKDSRKKFQNWFDGSVIPMLSDDGIIRIVGTILHMDSLLENILNDPEWVTKRYRAHNADFSSILWPEKFPKEKLQKIRRIYVNKGNPEGYAQEYLNHPIDPATAMFRKDDIVPIWEDWDEKAPLPELNYYAGMDFAIGESEKADFTVIAVAGVDSAGVLYLVDMRRGRWDSLEIVEEMFAVQQRYNPDIFTVEVGQIEKTLGPFLMQEELKRGIFLPLDKKNPDKDKVKRARSINARMRAGGIKIDTTAGWYPEFEEELLTFPRSKHDDQVDALSWIGLTLDHHVQARTPYEIEEDEWEEEYGDFIFGMGANDVTGY